MIRRALRGGVAALAVLAALAGFAIDVRAQEESAIKPGDSLFVDVYRRPELSTTVMVDPNGNVPISYVGNVNVGGASEKEAGERISNALLTILKNPKVTVSRSAQHAVASPRTADMKTQVVNLNNTNAESLSKSLQGMNSAGGSVSFDAGSNSLIITDTPATIQNIITAISQIDQMQSQVTQVRIEAKLAEVQEGAMKQLGIRWFYTDKNVNTGYYPSGPQLPGLGATADPMANERVSSGYNAATGSGFSRRFVDEPMFDRRLNVPVQVPVSGQMFFGLLNGSMDIGSMLDALVKDNKAQLLATPMILAVNHKPAEIKMTDEFPYTESSQTFGGTAFSVKFLDLGIKLGVTPHVYKDAGGPYVQMELKPEVSFSSGMSNGVPIRSVRSSDSVANVRNGQTLVIGGIVLNDDHNVVQKVPGFGSVPLLGSLFKRKERAHSRNELMVFVTPTIHDAPESITWDRMINLTGVAKQDFSPIPLQETRGEARKE